MISVFSALIVVALILSVAGLVWPRYPLIGVAVLLVTVALLVGGR